jgi:putative heme iron utilization protein
VLNFLTGVRRLNHDTGMIEYCYSMRAVAAAYSKSWLLLDVVSALPVECLVVLGVGGHNYNLGYLNRWGAVIWIVIVKI